MICAFCGHNNEPGVKFCARCGAQLQQQQQPPQQQPQQPPPPQQPPQQQRQQAANPMNQAGYGNAPVYGNAEGFVDTDGFDKPSGHRKKESGDAGALSKLPIKKILIIAVPVIILIIAAIIVIPMLGGGGNVRKDNISFFTDRGETIVSGNNNVKFTIDGARESSQASIDGSKAVVMTEYNTRSGGVLWFVTPTTSTLVANDVYAYILADSGNGVAYFTDYDERNEVATLYLYDTSSAKATLITEDAFYNGGSMPGVAISPNGKSISYISDYDGRNYEFTGYIKIDGKAAEKLGDEMFALIISDGGRYLYFCKVDLKTEAASLHVRSGRNEFRLITDLYSSASIMLNKDYSEILFNMDDRTFISRRGGERERISGAVIWRLLLPRGTQTRNISNDVASITAYGISSFTNFVAITDDGLAYYNSKLEANKITNSDRNAYGAEISSDGKTLYYMTNSDRLSSINPAIIGAERVEIDKNVRSFVASTNGKSVYYVNDDSELYYASGSGTPVKISDDVSYDSLAMSYSGNRVFFLVDYRSSSGGELYYSNNGGRRAKVPSADEVMRIWSTPANIFFVTRDDELFRSNGNERFTKFHDEID